MRTIFVLFIFCLLFQPMAQAENFVTVPQKEIYKSEKYVNNIGKIYRR